MGFGSADYIHHFVEAKKIAFADRAKYYADMDFNEIPVEYLISKEYADIRRKDINSENSASTVSPGNIENGDTIYLTTADSEGNMVSLIQSNYRGWDLEWFLKDLDSCSKTEVSFFLWMKIISMYMPQKKDLFIQLSQHL